MNVFCQGYKKIKINSSSSFQEVFSSLIGFTQTNSNDQTGPLNWVWGLVPFGSVYITDCTNSQSEKSAVSILFVISI